MGAASFNTLFVLLVFHVLSPTTNAVIGERLVDTFIGCGLALLCSYILPWWEHSFMGSLARAARKSNQAFLQAGLCYAELTRAQAAGRSEEHTSELQSLMRISYAVFCLHKKQQKYRERVQHTT